MSFLSVMFLITVFLVLSGMSMYHFWKFCQFFRYDSYGSFVTLILLILFIHLIPSFFLSDSLELKSFFSLVIS